MAGERLIGAYSVQAEIGVGGMGTLYRAIDTRTQQIVAIKQLKSELAQPQMIERFKREGEALRALNHPNIVKMLDMLEDDGQHYLVIEYIAGGDLNMLLKNSSLPVKRVLEIALDLADALTRAHRLNIIHRDLKPANILIADDGSPRLTDFGVAHFGTRERITGTGVAVGTLDYLSPEALNGDVTDARTDIWAFGVILFEMLAGQRPFGGEKISNVITRILTEAVPDLAAFRQDVPVPLADLIYRMLAKNVNERIPSVRLVGAELEALLHDSPSTIRPAPRIEGAAQKPAFASTTPAKRATQHNLPHQTTLFVGRVDELDSLRQLLTNPAIPLVTILGPGGMGKTRLSIETARSMLPNFQDGVFFVELAPIESADAIPMTVGKALHYPFQENGRSPQEQMVDYFREKELLLVLDNFEHVIEGRDFVQAMLQAAPRLKILVTSRTRLNLSGENVFYLEGMELPDLEALTDVVEYAAVRLFLESVRRVRPGYDLTREELPYAARICHVVQGLPLAIVLAGTWLELLSLKEVAEEIEKSIDFLESSMHDIPERQRTMRAVFDYSWRLLSDEERQAFACLSVFRGGMMREAAQAVADTPLRTLQSLVNKSILRRDTVSGRYQIHELLRQYAGEFLTQSGNMSATQGKHAAYFAAFLAARDADIKGKRQLQALREIEADFENVKTAWHFAWDQRDEALVSSMLETLYWSCIFRSHNADGMDLFQKARQQCSLSIPNPPLLAARLAIRYPEKLADPAALFTQCLAIAESYGDEREIAFCKRQLGHWHSHSQMDQGIGIPLLEASLAQYRALGDYFYAAVLLDDIGWSYNLDGDGEKQVSHVQQSLELRRQIGDKIGMTNALRNLGGAAGGFGTTDPKPLQYWQEALQLAVEIDERTSIAWNNLLISIYWQFNGEFEKALPLRQEARRVASAINDSIILDLCTISDALDLIVLENNYQQAEQLVLAAYPPDSPIDLRFFVVHIDWLLLGCVKRDSERVKTSGIVYTVRGMQRDHQMIAISVFASMVRFAIAGKYEEAAEMLGTLQSQPTLSINLLLRRWNWFEQFQHEIEQALGADLFQAAVARGKGRDLGTVAREIYETMT